MEQSQRTGNFGGKYYPKGSITPQPGDIVYYDGSEVNNSSGHVEIVISYNASKGTIDSIGGNTGGGNGAVIRHNGRSLSTTNSATTIIGFERPNYDDVPPSNPWVFKIENAPKCSSTRWIGEGGVTSGDDVKWVQYALNVVNNAGLEVDGAWGSKSAAATKAFQKKY